MRARNRRRCRRRDQYRINTQTRRRPADRFLEQHAALDKWRRLELSHDEPKPPPTKLGEAFAIRNRFASARIFPEYDSDVAETRSDGGDHACNAPGVVHDHESNPPRPRSAGQIFELARSDRTGERASALRMSMETISAAEASVATRSRTMTRPARTSSASRKIRAVKPMLAPAWRPPRWRARQRKARGQKHKSWTPRGLCHQSISKQNTNQKPKPKSFPTTSHKPPYRPSQPPQPPQKTHTPSSTPLSEDTHQNSGGAAACCGGGECRGRI